MTIIEEKYKRLRNRLENGDIIIFKEKAYKYFESENIGIVVLFLNKVYILTFYKGDYIITSASNRILRSIDFTILKPKIKSYETLVIALNNIQKSLESNDDQLILSFFWSKILKNVKYFKDKKKAIHPFIAYTNDLLCKTGLDDITSPTDIINEKYFNILN